MAYFEIYYVEVSYHGTDEALKQFEQAVAARKSGAVKRVLKRFQWDAEKHAFSGIRAPYRDFKPLMRLFPELTFVFDVEFDDEVGGQSGNGRYFTVYEAGERVYDAGKRAEWKSFVDSWCEKFGKPKNLSESEQNTLLEPLYNASCRAMNGEHGYFNLYKIADAAKNQEEAGKLHGYRDYLNKKNAGALPCFHAEGFRWQLDDEDACDDEDITVMDDDAITGEICLEAVREDGKALK